MYNPRHHNTVLNCSTIRDCIEVVTISHKAGHEQDPDDQQEHSTGNLDAAVMLAKPP